MKPNIHVDEAQSVSRINNDIMLRRRRSVILPAAVADGLLPLNVVAAFAKDAERLGFGFSNSLISGLQRLSLDQITAFHADLMPLLMRAKGAHKSFRPMYPNFPSEVMGMETADLYLNALVHYLSLGEILPRTEVKTRFPLLDEPNLVLLGDASVEKFQALFGDIVASNVAFSEQDVEDVKWFVSAYGGDITPWVPTQIPQKENAAVLAGVLLELIDVRQATEITSRFLRTATDVLRLAVALSGGDVSLAVSTRFRSFRRPERTLMLSLLERIPFQQRTEDMLRWKGRWIRVGERLHPAEHPARYPETASSFEILRRDIPYKTFNGQVEDALATRNISAAVHLLQQRPGDFARRLDHVLRLADNEGECLCIQQAFAKAAAAVSTPVLLQVREHLLCRDEGQGNQPRTPRVFFPKGQIAKVQVVDNNLPDLGYSVRKIIDICEETLKARFAELPSLGRVYVDPKLAGYLVPHGMRSASRSFRTVVRGSRIALPDRCNTLRFFVWWKDGTDRTDVDLSATLFDEDFVAERAISYMNLQDLAGCHSGDITSAPKGAAEFIDIDRAAACASGIRYVVMTLNSYTSQTYAELPECYAGWMSREHPNSGEIFEPKTVQDRLDITAESTIAIPLIIDLVERTVIWTDLSLKRNPQWVNNIEGNLRGINAALWAMTSVRKPNLYDLFRLHGEARGKLVSKPEDAGTIFSVEKETPYRLEEIGSQYMR